MSDASISAAPAFKDRRIGLMAVYERMSFPSDVIEMVRPCIEQHGAALGVFGSLYSAVFHGGALVV